MTRGHGLLEGFLARQRTSRAEALLASTPLSGRVLDIGCGTYPLFLLQSRFAERFGIDRVAPAELSAPGLTILRRDIADPGGLPFEADYFDAVTMLAVFEHIETTTLARLLREVHRVLHAGGAYVMTTPASWTEGILSVMARVGLVSREEVGEHKGAYTHAEITSMLRASGFDPTLIRRGAFEAGMNLWVRAEKGR